MRIDVTYFTQHKNEIFVYKINVGDAEMCYDTIAHISIQLVLF